MCNAAIHSNTVFRVHRRLFAGENFKFGSPVRKLQKDLRAGYLYLEVFKHKRALRQAKYREYKHQQELRCHRMLKEVLISRQVGEEKASLNTFSARAC